MQLSIVTSSYTVSRILFLEKLLSSICSQSFKDFETIVVADGNEDLYSDILALVHRLNLPDAKVLQTSSSGASACRNFGLKSASGNIVAFVDDDVVLDNDWAQETILFFETNSTATGLVGSARPLWMNPQDSWFPVPLYWIVSCTDWFKQETREVTNMWTMNCVAKRDDVLTCGGFQEQLGPQKGREAGYAFLAEDFELSKRLRATGGKIFYVPSVKCRHHVQHSQVEMRYVIQRSLWIGRERKIMARLGENQDVEAGTLRTALRFPLNNDSNGNSIISKLRGALAISAALISISVGLLS